MVGARATARPSRWQWWTSVIWCANRIGGTLTFRRVTMAFPLPVLFKSRRFWFIALGAVVVLWLPAAYPRGMASALIDHALGHYEVQTSGLRRGPSRYDLLLEQTYGVQTREYAGCVSLPWEDWFAN